MEALGRLEKTIVAGDRDGARAAITDAMAEGIPAQKILDAMTKAMGVVGQRFERQEIFIPEMLVSARAMRSAMKLLEPSLLEARITPLHRAVIGTVQGDIHDIGKNLVSVMWSGANIEVIDLGTNVPPVRFVAAVREHSPDLVGLSALLTTTMPGMKKTIELIRASTETPMKILVGGAPVTEEYSREIGADGYAANAGRAVDVARQLLTV